MTAAPVGTLLRIDPRPSSPPAPVRAAGSKNVFNHVAAVAMLGADLELLLRGAPENSDRENVRCIATDAGLDWASGPGWVRVSGTAAGTGVGAVGERMRASVCFGIALGAGLGRSRFPGTGGCAFTERPIDVHLRVVEAAGGRIASTAAGVALDFPSGPRGFSLSVATRRGTTSVGASVSALLVAARATGRSRILDASSDREVVAVAETLTGLGVAVVQQPDGTIEVEGAGGPLRGSVTVDIPPDHTESGTYLLAGLLRSRRVELAGIRPDDFAPGFRECLDRIGVVLTGRHVRGLPGAVADRGDRLRAADIRTGAHPGFPTDLQPQMAAFLSQAEGRSHVHEEVYDRRVSHVAPLARLGVGLHVVGGVQRIDGPQRVRGAPYARVTDIRCGAAIIVAAAAAGGPTTLHDPDGHLARGYGNLRGGLRAIGLTVEDVRPAPVPEGS